MVRRFADVPGRAAWLAIVDAVEVIDLRPALARIAAPTLVVCGRRDRHCVADARAAAAAIPGGHLLLLSHVGHAWPPYHAKLFASVATGFLSAPDRPG